MRSTHIKQSKSLTRRNAAQRSTRSLSPAIVPLPLCGVICAGALVVAPPTARAQVAGTPVGATKIGPIVAILQPSYADTLQGTKQVLLGVQAQKYAPKTVEMFVDGKSATGGPVNLESSLSSAFDWDTTVFTDGPHRLSVRVTDTQGFIGQSEVQVYINNGKRHDTAPPALSWLGVQNGDILKGSVHLGVQASDDFGVKYIFLSLNPAATPNRKPALRQYFLNRPPYDVLFNSTSVPDGLYVLDAMAWDALENEGHASQRLLGVMNNSLNPTEMSRLDAVRGHDGTDDSQGGTPSQGSTANSSSNSTTTQTVAPTDVTPVQSPIAPPALPPTVPVIADQPNHSATATRIVTGGTRPTGEISNGDTGPAHRQPELPPSDAMTPLFMTRQGALSPAHDLRIATGTPREPRFEPSLPVFNVRTLPRPTTGHNQASTSVMSSPLEPTVASGHFLSSPSLSDGTERITAPSVEPRTAPQSATRVAAIIVPEQHIDPRSLGTPLTQVLKAGTLSRVAKAAAPAWTHSNPLRLTRLDDFATPRPLQKNVSPKIFGTVQLTSVAPNQQSRITAPGVTVARPMVTPPMRTGQFAMMPPQAQPRAHHRAAITVSPASDVVPAAYVARGGETLSVLAARFGLSPVALAAVNGMTAHAKLVKGTKIALPRVITVSYKGKPVKSDVGSIMVGSTSATAFRHLFEAQGGTVKWDAANHRVLAQNGEQQVVLTIGSRTAVVNEQAELMEMAAFLLSGRTMVPVRFFEKSLHAEVQWEPSTNRLFVSIAGPNVL